jgi:hypothetical protein
MTDHADQDRPACWVVDAGDIRMLAAERNTHATLARVPAHQPPLIVLRLSAATGPAVGDVLLSGKLLEELLQRPELI